MTFDEQMQYRQNWYTESQIKAGLGQQHLQNQNMNQQALGFLNGMAAGTITPQHLCDTIGDEPKIDYFAITRDVSA